MITSALTLRYIKISSKAHDLGGCSDKFWGKSLSVLVTRVIKLECKYLLSQRDTFSTIIC